jgi:hypothetical protein
MCWVYLIILLTEGVVGPGGSPDAWATTYTIRWLRFLVIILSHHGCDILSLRGMNKCVHSHAHAHMVLYIDNDHNFKNIQFEKVFNINFDNERP